MDKIKELRQSIIDGKVKVIDTRTITEDQRKAFYADRTCKGVDALKKALGM